MAFSPDAYISPRPFIESGKATVPGLIEWHARENPSIDVFRFYTGRGVGSLTYREVDKGVHRAARLVSSFVGSGTQVRHVVAILASAGTSGPGFSPATLCVLKGLFHRLHHLWHHHLGHPSCWPYRVPHLTAKLACRCNRPSAKDAGRLHYTVPRCPYHRSGSGCTGRSGRRLAAHDATV